MCPPEYGARIAILHGEHLENSRYALPLPLDVRTAESIHNAKLCSQADVQDVLSSVASP